MKDKRKRGRSDERSFLSGVLLLSVSTVVVKLLGLGFKIPMLSLLGAEGMGYFNSALEIYALLCTIATAGLPVALSILVASARARGEIGATEAIYRSARRLFLIIGVCFGALMLLLSEELASLIGNPSAAACIRAISPALLFVCLSGAVRGYCQGFEYMTPTALSQLIEATAKLMLGVLFSTLAIRRGYSLPGVAACAVLGVSVGCLISLLYLVVARRTGICRRLLKNGENLSKIRGTDGVLRLLRIALPITLGSLVIGLTRIIDMTLIMHRLGDVGISAAARNEIYGAYTTLSLPVFSLIPALIAPVSVALVPQLSAFVQSRDSGGEATVSENSLRLTVIFALPSSLGLTLFARPILELLFSGQTEAIAISAPLLSALGGSVLFSCLITTTNAILQAYGRPSLPIISMSAGVALKLVASWTLMGIDGIGALGAPLGSLLCNIAVTLINLVFISSYAKRRIRVTRLFFAPLAASVLSVGGAFLLYVYLTRHSGSASPAHFAAALILALLLYFPLSFLTGSLTKDDISLLPFARRIFGGTAREVAEKDNKKH